MCFGGRLLRRMDVQTAFWTILECLFVCDGLGGKSSGHDAFEKGVAGEAVGSVQAVSYESPSQFSREYKRYFGHAPKGDIK